MATRNLKQIRVSGALPSGTVVYSALQVDVNLKTDARCSEYLAEQSRALKAFHARHPRARVLEVRLMSYKEDDESW